MDHDYKQILKIVGVDPSHDVAHVHPAFFCNSCLLTFKRFSLKHPGELLKRVVVEWLPHTDELCPVCDNRCKGGRPKKKSSGGRPSALHQHIRTMASCVSGSKFTDSVDSIYKKDASCVKCNSIVDKPVEIQPCKSLACCSCCLDFTKNKNTRFRCPGCSSEHESITNTFTQISPIVNKIICDLLVKCEKCHKKIRLAIVNEDCCHHQSIDQNATLDDIIHQPLESEPTKIERQVAASLVKRILHQQSDNTIISIPRRGNVNNININNNILTILL